MASKIAGLYNFNLWEKLKAKCTGTRLELLELSKRDKEYGCFDFG
jgi:hypothetical protein